MLSDVPTCRWMEADDDPELEVDVVEDEEEDEDEGTTWDFPTSPLEVLWLWLASSSSLGGWWMMVTVDGSEEEDGVAMMISLNFGD